MRELKPRLAHIKVSPVDMSIIGPVTESNNSLRSRLRSKDGRIMPRRIELFLTRAMNCREMAARARSDASRDLFEHLARTWTLLAKDIDDAQDFKRETRKLLENNEGVA